MKIATVTATTHRLDVQVPLIAKPLVRYITFTRIQTEDGLAGYGLSAQTTLFSVREFINRELAPFLIGRDPIDTERLSSEMYLRFNQRGYSGTVQTGISAVDIACWDLKGKYLGLPVWRLLGGFSQTVSAYITFGLPEYGRQELATLARQLVSEGHDKLKMVVGVDGGIRLAEDAERVRVVREAIGDSVQLMVDANQLLDKYQAQSLCRRIEPYDIAWFEEPIYANDVHALAELRRATRIPISAGQSEGHRWRHRDLIVGGAIDIVQPNVLFVGGYTEALKVAHLAQAFSLPVMNGGGWPHHNAQLLAGIANGRLVEFHYWTWMIGEAIFRNPPRVKSGSVTLPDAPGLGLEPNEDALAKTRQE